MVIVWQSGADRDYYSHKPGDFGQKGECGNRLGTGNYYGYANLSFIDRGA